MGTIPSIVTANSSAEPDSGRRNSAGRNAGPAFANAGATPQPAKRKPPRP